MQEGRKAPVNLAERDNYISASLKSTELYPKEVVIFQQTKPKGFGCPTTAPKTRAGFEQYPWKRQEEEAQEL